LCLPPSAEPTLCTYGSAKFSFELKGTRVQRPASIEMGWLTMHKSGTYLRFSEAGAELFA
jgi:hypothetical protein